MVGASDGRIIRSHLLPHLVAPIIVYSTLVVAQNILAEAGLSFLGVGIQLPTASWGNLLCDGAAVLPDPAVADALARARRAAHDARVQPARRRPARRVRPARVALAVTSAQPLRSFGRLTVCSSQRLRRWRKSARPGRAGVRPATTTERSDMRKKALAFGRHGCALGAALLGGGRLRQPRPRAARERRRQSAGGTTELNMSDTDFDFTRPGARLRRPVVADRVPDGLSSCSTTRTSPAPQGSQARPGGRAGFPKVSNSGKTYTFTIRKRASSSSRRQPVTAANFANAINRDLNKTMQSPAVTFIERHRRCPEGHRRQGQEGLRRHRSAATR